MVKIRIITNEKKIIINPQDVQIGRNEKYAEFYRLVDNYEPLDEKNKVQSYSASVL